MSKKTMILIDGHALAFRSYFALERTAMKTTDMQPTWAVYGFFKAIFDMLKNKFLTFDCIAVAFDVGHQTFRVEKYEQYKANRASMPDALRSQMELIAEGLRAFNIPIYTKEGYEADDVIGTIATKSAKEGNQTIILTGDKDAFQLVDDAGLIKVLIPSKGELVEYNKKEVFEKMGVYPNQIIDFKGLSGDTSDNIPGVRGIGDKTAASLLGQFGNIDGIYEHIDEIDSKLVKTKLINGKDNAILSRDLATIRTNVDIDFDIDCARLELPDFTQAQAFFKSLQFYGFLKNFEQIKGYFSIKAPNEIKMQNSQENIVKFNENAQVQLGLFGNSLNDMPKIDKNYEKICVDNEKKLDDLVSELKKQSFFAINTETTSHNIMHEDLVGISIAYNSQLSFKDYKIIIDETKDKTTKAFYIPLFHKIGEQLDLDLVLEKIKPLLEDKTIKKTFQNVKFDFNVFRKYNIKIEGVFFDTMLASYVKNSARKHELKIQALEHLDYIIATIDELIGIKGESSSIENITIEEATNYTCDNTFAILEMTKFWMNNLSRAEKKLVIDVETPLALVLADMEWTGISIDKDYLNKLSANLKVSLKNLEHKIYNIVGTSFNISSPKQVGDILFKHLEIKPPKKAKTKTGYSTSAQVLEQLAPDYPVAEKILEYRHLSKLLSTYLEPLPELVDPYDGRIHASYNQTVTVTGRLSSSNPNLQNIPIRSDLGNKIRGAFVPKDKNSVILSADYSQIELRLLAHYSKDENLTKAFLDNIDVHTLTASKAYGIPSNKVTKEMRRKAKAVNFGIVYGQTRWGLASALKISNEEAALFIDKYFATYPMVKKYMEETIATAYEKGYVETMYGRRRYLADELHSSTRQIKEFAERAAINTPLQGSAADLIKTAMNDLFAKLEQNKLKSKIIMQVHDELVLEVPNSEIDITKKLVQEAMELGQPLNVPLVVDINVAESWQE